MSLFRDDELLETVCSSALNQVDFNALLGGRVADAAIFSGVAGDDTEAYALIAGNAARVINVKEVRALPIRVDYKSPETLGSDRVAAAVGAADAFPGRNVLVVDAGSALTIDLVTEDGAFVGGRISPGMTMRFRALHRFTGRLPMVTAYGDVPTEGYDTKSSIRAGVVRGIAGEISSAVKHYGEVLPGLVALMTGGDASFLSGYVNENITVDENLLVKGLNRILLYNEDI